MAKSEIALSLQLVRNYMKLDIPYYIRQVLREQRKVYVPGIGTFHLKQSYAQFSDDKTELRPPSLQLTYDESETEDTSLLKYILDTGKLSEEKAQKKIRQYAQNAFNTLLNVDSFVIEGLGRLSKPNNADKVSFEPDVESLTQELNGLKALHLTPVQRIAEQEPIVPVSAPLVEPTSSFLPRVLLLSLLLICLWFLGRYILNMNDRESTDSEKIENVEGDESSESLDEGVADDDELQQKYQEIDQLIDPVDETKIKGSMAVKGDPDAENEQKGSEDVDTENEDQEKNTADLNSSDDAELNDDPTLVDSGAAQSTGNENPHADILPPSGECIIIVGSFKKSVNAVKMTSLLERKGYEVYRSSYQGFTRIGLKYECIDEDLEAYLQSIRKKISKKAWYLDPELEVPYEI